jgi:hypothetical protein
MASASFPQPPLSQGLGDFIVGGGVTLEEATQSLGMGRLA